MICFCSHGDGSVQSSTASRVMSKWEVSIDSDQRAGPGEAGTLYIHLPQAPKWDEQRPLRPAASTVSNPSTTVNSAPRSND